MHWKIDVGCHRCRHKLWPRPDIDSPKAILRGVFSFGECLFSALAALQHMNCVLLVLLLHCTKAPLTNRNDDAKVLSSFLTHTKSAYKGVFAELLHRCIPPD
ncbi:hypothetical protein MTP99_015737 [Tenebrio molitor]|jgi:hypothetical protein|nr:hypothetical protein MTP99_015737 [Tenebrio molitor]